ncbi:hypothetical protein GOBAR_DD17731 [Gossypium barbadense]|nr:hypothetical protein GOBAR_DD17731 [Gossypium barbadense]
MSPYTVTLICNTYTCYNTGKIQVYTGWADGGELSGNTQVEGRYLVLKMDNQFFVCVYFDREILRTTVGCIFEFHQQIAMRFNRNMSVDDMKEIISAKIVKCCRRRMSKLFFKFPVSSNPIKFKEMKFVDDEDVETMVALCCRTRSVNAELIQLFAKLADVEPVEDFTPLSEQYGVQDLCMEVLRAFFDRQSSICGFNIDLNAPPAFENLNPGPCL